MEAAKVHQEIQTPWTKAVTEVTKDYAFQQLELIAVADPLFAGEVENGTEGSGMGNWMDDWNTKVREPKGRTSQRASLTNVPRASSLEEKQLNVVHSTES